MGKVLFSGGGWGGGGGGGGGDRLLIKQKGTSFIYGESANVEKPFAPKQSKEMYTCKQLMSNHHR